jgi:hypothetical protein
MQKFHAGYRAFATRIITSGSFSTPHIDHTRRMHALEGIFLVLAGIVVAVLIVRI